jgi:hypothetical protein
MAHSHIRSNTGTMEAVTTTKRSPLFYCRASDDDEILSLSELLSRDPMDQGEVAAPTYAAHIAPLLHDRGAYRVLTAGYPRSPESGLLYTFDHTAPVSRPKRTPAPIDRHRAPKHSALISSPRSGYTGAASPLGHRHNLFLFPGPLKQAPSTSGVIPHALALCCSRRIACLEQMHEQNARTLRLMGQARQEIDEARRKYGRVAWNVDAAAIVLTAVNEAGKEARDYLAKQKAVRRAVHKAGKELLEWVVNQKALRKAVLRALTIFLTAAGLKIFTELGKGKAKQMVRMTLKAVDSGAIWEEIGSIGHILVTLTLEADSPSYWATVVTQRKQGLTKALGTDADDVQDEMADSLARLDEVIHKLSQVDQRVRAAIAVERRIKCRALKQASVN